MIFLGLLLKAFLEQLSGFPFNLYNLCFLMQCIFFLLLIRDVCSRAASMVALVCLTRKNKHFHARVMHPLWTGDKCEVRLGNNDMLCSYGSV